MGSSLSRPAALLAGAFLLVTSCPAPLLCSSNGKFAPPDGKVLLIIGQDIDNLKDYVNEVRVIPAGFVAYNYFTTGEISLIPSTSLSPEEEELNKLEKEFHKAQNEFLQGSKGASLAGLDTPADVIGAMREMNRVEREVVALKQRMTSGKAKVKDLYEDILLLLSRITLSG